MYHINSSTALSGAGDTCTFGFLMGMRSDTSSDNSVGTIAWYDLNNGLRGSSQDINIRWDHNAGRVDARCPFGSTRWVQCSVADDSLKGWNEAVSPRTPKWVHFSVDLTRTFGGTGSLIMEVYVNGGLVGSDTQTQSSDGLDLTDFFNANGTLWVADSVNPSPEIVRRINFGSADSVTWATNRAFFIPVAYFTGGRKLGTSASRMNSAFRALIPDLPATP